MRIRFELKKGTGHVHAHERGQPRRLSIPELLARGKHEANLQEGADFRMLLAVRVKQVIV